MCLLRFLVPLDFGFAGMVSMHTKSQTALLPMLGRPFQPRSASSGHHSKVPAAVGRAEAEAGPGRGGGGGGGHGGREAQRDMDNAFGDAFGAAPARDAKRARFVPH